MFEDFDKKFDQLWKMNLIFMVFGVVVSCGVLGFLGWVIVKLLMFWGVV